MLIKLKQKELLFRNNCCIICKEKTDINYPIPNLAENYKSCLREFMNKNNYKLIICDYCKSIMSDELNESLNIIAFYLMYMKKKYKISHELIDKIEDAYEVWYNIKERKKSIFNLIDQCLNRRF